MHLLVVCLAFLMSGGTVNTPQDLDKSLESLKDAGANGDPAQVKALATQTYDLAKGVIATPAPANAADKKDWADQVDYAKSIELQADYVIYTRAIQGPAAVTVDLFSTLEQLNPASKYLDLGYGSYFYALRETGAAAKIPTIAEHAVAHFPANDAALLVLADSAMTRKQPDRAIAYADRLVAALNRKAKPEGESEAEWTRTKDTELGHGYWVAGLLRCEKGQYYQANENLRAALPLIKGSDAMMAPALFYLGLANYQLGKQTLNRAQIREAAKFSEQAAGYKGPLQDQAQHNALVMRQEADSMR